MSDRFRVLRTTGGPDRHATLRAALDWSWDLRTPAERLGLGQLAVFSGGFTLEAADAVLEVGDAWAEDVVQALVEHSLVRATGYRFDLLLAVHDYATERLDDAAGAHARHGQWAATWGTDAALAALDQHGGVERRRAAETELGNVVAACRRAAARGDVEVAVCTLRAAWAVLEARGPHDAAAALVERVLKMPGLDAEHRGLVRWVEGRVHHVTDRTGLSDSR